jgi:hypothetical protein
MTTDAAEIAILREIYRGTPAMVILDELEKARAERDAADAAEIARLRKLIDERDAARTLLREIRPHLWGAREALGASIDKLLGDA